MFYENLKRICKERGLYPTSVMRRAGLATARTYKRDCCVPRSLTVYKVAYELGVGVEELVPVDEMEPETLCLYNALHGAKDIASKLQLMRCYHEWTYCDMGEIAGAANLTIRKWACGQQRPLVQSIDLLCKRVNIHQSYLLDSSVPYDPSHAERPYAVGAIGNVMHSAVCIRAMRGRTDNSFAQAMEVHKSVIDRFECDAGALYVDTLQFLAEKLGVSVTSLLDNTETSLRFSEEFAKMSVGERIRYLRIRDGRTLDWMGRNTSLSKTQLSYVEVGSMRRALSAEESVSIAKALRVKPSLLNKEIRPETFYLCNT